MEPIPKTADQIVLEELEKGQASAPVAPAPVSDQAAERKRKNVEKMQNYRRKRETPEYKEKLRYKYYEHELEKPATTPERRKVLEEFMLNRAYIEAIEKALADPTITPKRRAALETHFLVRQDNIARLDDRLQGEPKSGRPYRPMFG